MAMIPPPRQPNICGVCMGQWFDTHVCPGAVTNTSAARPTTLAGQFAQAMKPWELVGWWCEVEQSMGRAWHLHPDCDHEGKGCGDVYRKAD